MPGFRPLVLGAVVICLLAVLASKWPRGDKVYELVSWCYSQQGGVVPTLVLKLLQSVLDREELREGRGVDTPPSLRGRTVLITGSSQGIGFEAAKHFHARGAHVIISGRNQERCDMRAAMIRERGGEGSATGTAVNLEDLDDVRRFAGELWVSVPAIDYLVLNAAQGARRAPTAEEQMTRYGHDRSYTADYLSNFLFIKLMAPKIASGGTVVLVSSIVMWSAAFEMLIPPTRRWPWEEGVPFRSIGIEHPGEIDVYMQYQVSKLALCVCFRNSLQAELGPRGVRVNSMVPGYVATNMTKGVWTHPHYNPTGPWAYHTLASVENGGRVLFESAFATPLPPDHDFLYAFWLPPTIFRYLRPRHMAMQRLGMMGFVVQPQAYQRVSNYRLHSSVSPECDAETQRALWSWSLNATGLPHAGGPLQ